MKLLVHNMLTSKFLKGVSGAGYPLRIVAEKVEKRETDYNEAFVRKQVERLDYAALRGAAESLGEAEGLPESLPSAEELAGSGDAGNPFLRRLHYLLLELDVLEGRLECPETGRAFPITNGIPNMLVNEDEVA